MSKRTWYRVEAKAADPTLAEIHIIDVIASWDDDWLARNFGYDLGVSARAFVEALAALPEAVSTIYLHINSPGGDVQAGINIANALREQQVSKGRTVETFIDGIAASIASVIAMAGSRVHIGDNALMMVHNPYSWAIGDAAEMRKVADILDTMRGQAINTYQWHSPLSAEALAALMDAETWMNADEAIANGLATDKVAGLTAAASIDPRAAARLKVPPHYADRVKAFLAPTVAAPAPPPSREAESAAGVLRLCRAGDCLELAEELLAAGATGSEVEARVASARQAKADARTRSEQITALCVKATLPELSAGYIAGAMTIDAVKAHLTTLTARLDKVEIDGSLPADLGARPKARVNTPDIYAMRNGTATTTTKTKE